jgi:glutamate-1-semialdehyde 2,1-aminomutase
MLNDTVQRFTATHAKSKEWWERSLKVSRGVHHDSRVAQPFPIHISYASGPRKWDVDGNEYIDYTMGHGSLMFGHAHPTLVEAVNRQVALGTHFGCETPHAVEWAELIGKMIPAAERVEFTMTGTEADMMIAQLARAYTGRQKILKFAEHFFGWSNDLHAGLVQPYDKPVAGRVQAVSADAVSEDTVVIPVNDRAAMERALAQNDIAAMFIEGGGAHFGGIAMPIELVKAARDLTKQHGTLLVIDEVITGFRWSPGGYQAAVGITPDLSSLGKMVSGGLPGAAVCGRADVMRFLEVNPGDDDWNRHRRVVHPGTWNGNPLAAVAGVAMLKMVASGEPQRRAETLAHRLATGMNEEIDRRDVDACAYNASSALHVHIGRCEKCDRVACFDAAKKQALGAGRDDRGRGDLGQFLLNLLDQAFY